MRRGQGGIWPSNGGEYVCDVEGYGLAMEGSMEGRGKGEGLT